MVVALEAAARPELSAALETTSAVGRKERVMAKGPSDTAAVADETGRELSLALRSVGHHPPA